MWAVPLKTSGVDILPLLKRGDSYCVQRGITATLNHFGGFLLLTTIVVHFTGEPGTSCPWAKDYTAILFRLLSILALKNGVFRIT